MRFEGLVDPLNYLREKGLIGGPTFLRKRHLGEDEPPKLTDQMEVTFT